MGRCSSLPLSALCWVAAISFAACVCPDGWEEVRYQNSVTKCYQLSKGLYSFTDCQEQVCGHLGGTLVCIENEEEDVEVHRIVSEAGKGNADHWAAWIGFHEGKAEGQWAWTSQCISTYTSWHDGEPNDWCVDEDCALINPNDWGHGWFDAACQVSASTANHLVL